MPDYQLVAWLVPSLLGPIVVALITLVVAYHSERYAVMAYALGLIAWLASAVVSIGFNLYVSTIHCNWWSNGPMWVFDAIAAFASVVLLVLATATVLPELF